VYAVPGHPLFAERSVAVLLQRASEQGIRTVVESAVSLIDVVATAIGRDPVASETQLLDAAELSAIVNAEPFGGGRLAIDPTRPLLIAQVYDAERASAVKLALGRLYPDEHEVIVVRAADVPAEEQIDAIPLYALDRRPVDHLTTVWVDPLPSLAAARSPQTLQRIVARLRAPGGCPWDRAQTHETLRRAVIEEAYETVDAIDAGDPANLAEELGDLLLQVALHAQIAEEAGLFALEDVYDHVSRKLVRRHPHVFGDVEAATPADVVRTWEAVKADERAAAGTTPKPANPLDRLPRAMPAFDKATALLSPRKGSAVRETDEAELLAAGEPILGAIEAAVAAGLEPEMALAAALRRRYRSELEPES
ncbi:MAG TPA: MazG family protein, partial [Thermomicrobiales bacterium]|nr:MazG family protein [Thermomicrobiales bacterium]